MKLHTWPILISTLCLSFCATSGIKWPIISDLIMTKCSNSNVGTCDINVWFRAGAIAWSQVEPVIPPPDTVKVIPYGVHCWMGTQSGEFRMCAWNGDGTHSPALTGKCELKPGTWELTDDSTCTTSSSEYGPHTGSSPGAECVVFGIKAGPGTLQTLQTPGGWLSPTVVANSGDVYCIKPLPPNEICELSISDGGIIQHGVLGMKDSDRRSIELRPNCGNTPKIYFMSPNPIKLGDGVTTTLQAVTVSKDRIIVVSDLKTENAKPGSYQASIVAVVAPD